MIIGWDLDGVLYFWHELVLEYCKRENIVDKNMDLKTFFNPVNTTSFFDSGLTKVQRRNILDNPTFYEKEPISPKILKVLNKLAKLAEFVYITCRPNSFSGHVTRSWIKRNKLPYSDNVYLLPGKKTEIVKQASCDIYVDDRVDFANELKDVTLVFLLTRPWNEDWKEPPSIVRIHSLDELVKYVEFCYS